MLRALTSLALAAATLPALARTADLPDGGEAPAPVIVYSYGADRNQRAELRVPQGTGPFPVAVLLHGGCWDAKGGELRDTAPLAAALTARGIATWNIEYRRLGNAGGGYPGTFEDVAAATDFLTGLAAAPGMALDLSRVAVIGHDSGAHLALWLAARPKLHDPIAGAMTVKPITVVAIDGVGSLISWADRDAALCGRSVIAPFMGGSPREGAAAYALASPEVQLPLGVHQILIQGTWLAMDSYARSALASGDTVIKLAPGGADHGNLIRPQTPQGKQVADFIAAQAF